MWEIVVAFLPQIVQFCLLVLGVYVSLRPPRKEHHVRFIICFCVLGVVGIVLTTWEQRSLGSQLNAIQKNTEQPVKFTVNVPPPTVQLLPPSNEKVTRRTGEALFVDCSLAVLPKKVTSDRVYVLSYFHYPLQTATLIWGNTIILLENLIGKASMRERSTVVVLLIIWTGQSQTSKCGFSRGTLKLFGKVATRVWVRSASLETGHSTSLKLMWDQKMPSFFISGIRVTRLPDSPSPIKQLFNSLVKPRGRLH